LYQFLTSDDYIIIEDKQEYAGRCREEWPLRDQARISGSSLVSIPVRRTPKMKLWVSFLSSLEKVFQVQVTVERYIPGPVATSC
jgi:hypothetical protein